MIWEGTLLLASGALLIGGMIAMLVSVKYRTDKHPPIPSFNPRHWLPLWKARDWYTPKGYRLAFWGGIAVSSGALLSIIRRLLLQ
jgi:hypothetical protein